MMDWLNDLEERIMSLMESVKQLDIDGLRSPLAPESNSYIAGLHDAMIIARRVKEAHPPTGYDVYCSQDAPTFATWERVAANVKDENFVSEVVHGSEDWASDIWWDNDDFTEARLVSNQYPRVHEHEVLRRYRILPAGSPAPEGGAP